jgi:hypothetical protein
VPFPKPAASGHIIVGRGGTLSRERIFSLLTHPDARAWIPGDERSLHIMMSEEWVFKTHPDHRVRSFLLLLDSADRVTDFYRRCGVWHPSQQWFIVWDGNECWLCNAAPRLDTLDRASRVRRAAGLLQIIAVLVRALLRAGVVIDPQLENFAMERGSSRLYYIDDEVYRWAQGRFDGAHGLEVLDFPAARKSSALDR